MPRGSDLTDADIARMLGWSPSVFNLKEGSLLAGIRAVADEAARHERKSCAKVCRDAEMLIGEACIIGDDRHDAGVNVCRNLAEKIEQRGGSDG